MEIEKFSRKGKQPVGKQAQRQQPNSSPPVRDEFDDIKNVKSPMANNFKIVIPNDDDDEKPKIQT